MICQKLHDMAGVPAATIANLMAAGKAVGQHKRILVRSLEPREGELCSAIFIEIS